MRRLIKAMKALSDPNRVKIVKLLQRRSMCVCELRAALGVAQPTVSKHLKTLEEAGMVRYSKEGLWVNYSLVSSNGDHGDNGDSGGNGYASSLLAKMKDWLEDDPEIAALDNVLPQINRESAAKQ